MRINPKITIRSRDFRRLLRGFYGLFVVQFEARIGGYSLEGKA